MFPEPERRLRLLPGELQGDQRGAVGREEAGDGVAGNADAAAVLDNDGAGHVDRVAAWLARAEALHGRALSKQQSARVFFEMGRLAELTGGAVTATARYRQAYAIYPHPDRDAGPALRRLGLAP